MNKDLTKTPGFLRLTKLLYIKIILAELDKDPNLWLTFSHKKQVELHKIKDELNKEPGLNEAALNISVQDKDKN